VWYFDLHHVPGGRDAVRLGVGDVARQRRPVILVRDLVLQRRLHATQHLMSRRMHTASPSATPSFSLS